MSAGTERPAHSGLGDVDSAPPPKKLPRPASAETAQDSDVADIESAASNPQPGGRTNQARAAHTPSRAFAVEQAQLASYLLGANDEIGSQRRNRVTAVIGPKDLDLAAPHNGMSPGRPNGVEADAGHHMGEIEYDLADLRGVLGTGKHLPAARDGGPSAIDACS